MAMVNILGCGHHSPIQLHDVDDTDQNDDVKQQFAWCDACRKFSTLLDRQELAAADVAEGSPEHPDQLSEADAGPLDEKGER